MAAHIIHFYGPVTPASIEELRNCALSGIQEGHADELLISISSEGGNLAAGFTAYHFLRSLPVPVTTHNLGNVESIGVLLFLAGEKRLVVQHGRFTLHALHWGFGSGTVDHDRLAEYTASLNTVHLKTMTTTLTCIGGSGGTPRGRSGKLLIFRFTPRGLRRPRLETTRSCRISSSTRS